jgi:hypothetical protein
MSSLSQPVLAGDIQGAFRIQVEARQKPQTLATGSVAYGWPVSTTLAQIASRLPANMLVFNEISGFNA